MPTHSECRVSIAGMDQSDKLEDQTTSVAYVGFSYYFLFVFTLTITFYNISIYGMFRV